MVKKNWKNQKKKKKIMTKLCPRGKAAAKRKFKFILQHMRMHTLDKICAGKIKDPSGVKRKDFRGPKPAKGGGMMKPAASYGWWFN